MKPGQRHLTGRTVPGPASRRGESREDCTWNGEPDNRHVFWVGTRNEFPDHSTGPPKPAARWSFLGGSKPAFLALGLAKRGAATRKPAPADEKRDG
jgi:hypothetical protein